MQIGKVGAALLTSPWDRIGLWRLMGRSLLDNLTIAMARLVSSTLSCAGLITGPLPVPHADGDGARWPGEGRKNPSLAGLWQGRTRRDASAAMHRLAALGRSVYSLDGWPRPAIAATGTIRVEGRRSGNSTGIIGLGPSTIDILTFDLRLSRAINVPPGRDREEQR